MRRALLVSLLLAASAGPAQAAETVLSPAANVTGITAEAGQVVMSRNDTGVNRLVRWHNGAVDALPVGPRTVPFDADAGTDKNGKPVLTFSRCLTEPGPADGLDEADYTSGRGCSLYVLPLTGGGVEKELRVPGGGSLTTPSMWKGALAFSRTAKPGAQPTIGYLPAGASHVRTLGAGPVQACYLTSSGPHPCGSQGIDQLDLGPAGVAYRWVLRGGQVYGTGLVWDLRLAPVDGGRSQSLDGGLISGTCGYRLPGDASASADPIAYRVEGADCDVGTTSFATTAVKSGAHQEAATPGGIATASTRDGATTYWLRSGTTSTACVDACRLVASTGLALQDATPRGRPWANADFDVVRSHAGYTWAAGPDGVQLLRPPATLGCAPSKVAVPVFVSARWRRGKHTVTASRVGRSHIGQPIKRSLAEGVEAGYTKAVKCGEKFSVRYTVRTGTRTRSVTYHVRRNT